MFGSNGSSPEGWDRVEGDRSMADNMKHEQRLRIELQNVVKRFIEVELTQFRAEADRQDTQPEAQMPLSLDWHLNSGRAS